MLSTPGRFHASLITLSALLMGGILFSATLGFMEVSAMDVARVLAAKFTGAVPPADIEPVVNAVVGDVRMPRILTSVLVGGVLAVCGAVFQAVLLNPLADPYTLGVSSGAAFGASLVVVLRLFDIVDPAGFSIAIFAFGGALATLFAVLTLASGDRRLSSTSLILSGVIVAAILSAAIGFLKFLADEQVGIIIFWLMGSFSGTSWQNIGVLLPSSLLGCITLLLFGRDLNIMAGGERCAVSLGINTVRLRTTLLTICSLLTALCVSISGIIGFVGLIVPHLLRHIIGPDNRRLIALSFPAGGLLLLFADTMTRAVLPAEVPIGVLTALIGGPFFCFIFKKRMSERGATGF